MRLDNFEVIVNGGTEMIQFGAAVVEMPHKTEYSLTLKNYGVARCDANVEIDGNHVGTWRVDGATGRTYEPASITIDCPVSVNRKFICLKLDSQEGRSIGLVDNDNLGLITVTFVPEVARVKNYSSDVWRDGSKNVKVMRYGNSPSAAGTGLGSVSNMNYGIASRIERDNSNARIINIRLVATEPEPTFIPIPRLPRSTPIAPRIR